MALLFNGFYRLCNGLLCNGFYRLLCNGCATVFSTGNAVLIEAF
jgi:hypothetical protein